MHGDDAPASDFAYTPRLVFRYAYKLHHTPALHGFIFFPAKWSPVCINETLTAPFAFTFVGCISSATDQQALPTESSHNLPLNISLSKDRADRPSTHVSSSPTTVVPSSFTSPVSPRSSSNGSTQGVESTRIVSAPHFSGEGPVLTSSQATRIPITSSVQQVGTASRASSLRASLPVIMGVVSGALVVILGLVALIVAQRRRARLRVRGTGSGHALGEDCNARCFLVC